MNGHDAGRAWLLGELCSLWESCHDILEASVAKARIGTIRAGRRPNRHPESLVSLVKSSSLFEDLTYRLEGRDLLVPIRVE